MHFEVMISKQVDPLPTALGGKAATLLRIIRAEQNLTELRQHLQSVFGFHRQNLNSRLITYIPEFTYKNISVEQSLCDYFPPQEGYKGCNAAT